MGDFRQEWYLLVVTPSGEPIERIHICTFRKVWTNKSDFRIQVHIRFVNWQLKPMLGELMPDELSQRFELVQIDE